MKYSSNIKKAEKTLIVKFYYEKDTIPKQESESIDNKEAKEYASMNLILSKQRILVVGLGKKEELTNEKIRRLGANTFNKLKDNAENAFFEIKKAFDKNQRMAFLEGVNLAAYDFSKYRSEKRSVKIKGFNTDIDKKILYEELLRIDNLTKGVFMIRDLVNEPSNILNPTSFEAFARKVVKSSKNLKITTLNKTQLEKKGMGGILSVGKGSKDAPRMLVIEYAPSKAKKHIALVGKGVTFDSGGYNLKPTGFIEEMKQDMAGAATVLGTIYSAERLGIKKNIKVYMPLVENMVNDKAYRPGDIIKTYSKKTVEVSNTDAEGRLILIDALWYANEKKPEIILDFATLTGAMVVALGNTITGVMTNNDELYSDLFRSSKTTGEQIWQLPIYEEHEESLKTDYADLKSIGYTNVKPAAASITAAALLKQFVGKTPWAHFDIAGTAFSSENKDYLKKGGTGVMLRTLIDWLGN